MDLGREDEGGRPLPDLIYRRDQRIKPFCILILKNKRCESCTRSQFPRYRISSLRSGRGALSRSFQDWPPAASIVQLSPLSISSASTATAPLTVTHGSVWTSSGERTLGPIYSRTVSILDRKFVFLSVILKMYRCF